MSWEPAWLPDGRGGFRRNRADEGAAEEGEESGEMKEQQESKKTKDDDEEEGEITPVVPQQPQGGVPSRSSSTGHLDFRAGPYRGGGGGRKNTSLG